MEIGMLFRRFGNTSEWSGGSRITALFLAALLFFLTV
jgi:hypothetical protein